MKVILIPFQVDSPLQLKDNVEKILRLIKDALQQAAINNPQEKIKIVFPELTASTPDVGDDFYRILNEQIDALLEPIKKMTAIYANTSIYIGFPYIVNNNRHICHACVEGGAISFVRGKSELANNIKSVKGADHINNPNKTTSAVGGGPEYETRFFVPATGIQAIQIAGQQAVNFGVYSAQSQDNFISDNTALIICEEMFIGLEAGSNPEDNPIVKLAKKGVTTFIIPNASPNANYKMQNRAKALQKIADYVHQSGNTGITLHYVNWYGTHSGTNFFDGAAHHVFFDASAQKYVIKTQAHNNKPYLFDSNHPEKTANEGEYFLRDNKEKNNTLAFPDPQDNTKIVPLPYRNKLKNIYPILFADAEYAYQSLKNKCAEFKRKNIPCKGFFVSLSGGFDSAYTLTILALSLDIKLRKLSKSKGGFKNALVEICDDLNITKETFGDFYDKLMAASNIDEAAKLLKNQLTVAAYIKTANNSKETQDAAQSLAHDLGSIFDTIQIDSFYLDILLSYMFPKEFEKLSDDEQNEVREAYKKVLASTKGAFDENVNAFKACGAKYTLPEPKVVINWHKHGLTLENIQARTRAFINWIASDINGLAPTSNPNINESIMGYTTVCGDLHAGDFSITAHRQKIHIQQTLAYIQKYGVEENEFMEGSIKPVKAIEKVFKIKPSAELQQLVDDITAQFDEDSYGMTYDQLYEITTVMFNPSTDPQNNASSINSFELLQELRARDGMDRDEKLFDKTSDLDLLRMFNKVNSAFLFSRFKRRLMPISPISEDSIEPHAKLRYPLIGTAEYIQADLNMAFIRLITNNAPADHIMLALLGDKKFAEDITKLRIDTCDKKSVTSEAATLKLQALISNVPGFPGVKVDPIARMENNFIMAANINPIALNYADNLQQIKMQIDEACRKGATMLVFPEFTLTGHDLDDALRFVRNKHMELMLTHIAEYAKQRSGATLTVAMGHPWTPNNLAQGDRTQPMVSAMSILANGQVEKMILRSEPYQMPGKNKPYYESRQMRAVNNYQETVQMGNKNVQVTSDQNYEVMHNQTHVKMAFCFETPKQVPQDVVSVQVAGKFKPGVTNSIYVKKRGAPAASTCASGSIILTDKAGNTHAYTKPYSLSDVNAATFTLAADGSVVATNMEAQKFTDKQLKERKIANWLYAYLKSAPIKFQITLNGQIDSIFNIKMARSAIAQRFVDLGNMALNLKIEKVCAEMGIKHDQLGSFDFQEAAINALLNEKVIVLDLSSDPIQLPPEFNYIKPIHAPANDRLLDKIINEVRSVYNKPNTPLDRESIKKRYLSAISWMIAADKGTIPFCNGTRTCLGLNQMTFGGDLHQGPLSPSMHLSRTEIADMLNVTLSKEELNNDVLIDHFNQPNPLVHLHETYFNNVVDVAMFNQFKQVYFKWHEGQLSRNALPMLMETGKSPDKQTAHREMPFAQPLKHEFVELVLKLMFPNNTPKLEFNNVCNLICDRLMTREVVTAQIWEAVKQQVTQQMASLTVATVISNNNDKKDDDKFEKHTDKKMKMTKRSGAGSILYN